ncbi:hypothetical protein FGIG_12510 [Fasciola gigantica]|uniref:Uncharacterized protein n=1 Tax=Fasciola gigantica TaxID=46835 RepID=A0A504Z2L1_FASGI|nr:hypothetical protein FGIG_12510 [Fasciola gigantica]
MRLQKSMIPSDTSPCTTTSISDTSKATLKSNSLPAHFTFLEWCRYACLPSMTLFSLGQWIAPSASGICALQIAM